MNETFVAEQPTIERMEVAPSSRQEKMNTAATRVAGRFVDMLNERGISI